jgi:hypothetical protein
MEGGFRPNRKGEPRRGGRARGTRNRRTIQNFFKATETLDGLTVIDALLEQASMNRKMALKLYQDSDKEEFKATEFLNFSGAAVDALSKVAPFCHPKAQPKPPTPELPEIDIAALTDDQLSILIVRIRDRLGRRSADGADEVMAN